MFQNFECFDVLTFSTFLSREIINDLQKRVKRSEGRPHDFSGASMSDNVDVATTTLAGNVCVVVASFASSPTSTATTT